MVGKASLVGGILFSAVFLISGLAMLFVASNDGWVRTIDEGSTCANGNDCGNARVTLLILGGSFTATGVFSLFLTFYVAKRVHRWPARLPSVRPLDTTGDMASLLESFGIEIPRGDPAKARFTENTITFPPEVRIEPGSARLTLEQAARVSDALRPLGIDLQPEVLVGGSMGDGEDQRTPGAGPPAVAGLRPERATILRKYDRGATAGQQRLIEFELEVTPASAAPYRVTVASLVRESLVGLLVEGGTITVRVDPRDPQNVTIDWSEN